MVLVDIGCSTMTLAELLDHIEVTKSRSLSKSFVRQSIAAAVVHGVDKHNAL